MPENDETAHLKKMMKHTVKTVNVILKEFEESAKKIRNLELKLASQEEHFKQREDYYRTHIEGNKSSVIKLAKMVDINFDLTEERLSELENKPTKFEKICQKLPYLRKR